MVYFDKEKYINDPAEVIMNRGDKLFDGTKVNLVCGQNKKLFKKVWGKQDFCFDSLIHRNWVWVRILENCYVYVFCSTRGTDYEVVFGADRKEAKKDLSKFFNEIIELNQK